MRQTASTSIDTHRFSSGNWRFGPAHGGNVTFCRISRNQIHFLSTLSAAFAFDRLHIQRWRWVSPYCFARQKKKKKASQCQEHLHGCRRRCHYRLGTWRDPLLPPGGCRASCRGEKHKWVNWKHRFLLQSVVLGWHGTAHQLWAPNTGHHYPPATQNANVAMFSLKTTMYF